MEVEGEVEGTHKSVCARVCVCVCVSACYTSTACVEILHIAIGMAFAAGVHGVIEQIVFRTGGSPWFRTCSCLSS
jgi:hypothetical protein